MVEPPAARGSPSPPRPPEREVDGTEAHKRRADAAVQRLVAIVEGSDDAIISFDLEGTVATWNRGAEVLYGYSASDMIGEPVFRIVRADRYEALRASIARTAAGERVPTVETEGVRSDGACVPVSISVAPLVDASGRVIALCSIARDLTATHHLTRELHQAKEAAEAATVAKSRFLASMSHEIRTPLTALLGFADLLVDPKLSEADRLNYALVIRRNGEHLLSVINDILDLSKIEAGKLTIERIDCSLPAILSEVASLMRVRARERGLDFDVHFLTSVPAVIRTDPTRLRQVLLNLVGNAVKFTEEGSVRVLLSHDAKRTPRSLRIEVVDTGIGMTADQVATLFQAFRQADASMSRRFGGTGLGLSICKPLVQALGGDIGVRTAAGQGSTFTVTLVLDDTTDSRVVSKFDEAGQTLPANAQAAVTQLGGTVLLAEDGPDNQLLITALLRRHGLAVTLAEDGRRAIDRAWNARTAGTPFDLVLMDMQMPEVDGYSATAELRRRGYDQPIVALTAHAMAGERERCMVAGCDDYVSKPIDRTHLASVLARFLGDRAAPNAASPAGPPPSMGASASTMEGLLFSEYAADSELRDLVKAFVVKMPARVGEIRSAAEARDTGRLRTLIHQLKGAAGGYGFRRISEMAAEVETTLRTSPDADPSAVVVPLVQLCDLARAGRPG